MNEKKLIARFAASTAALAVMWYAGNRIHAAIRDANCCEPPVILLANGKEAGSASDTIKFVKADAKAQAMAQWPDEVPELNEFLSKFRCSGCSKNCLLIAPSCINGKTKNSQAIEIYAELYPEAEI